MTGAHALRFTWWHRDELQVVAVYPIIAWFFTRSPELQLQLFLFSALIPVLLWGFRGLGHLRARGRLTPFGAVAFDSILELAPPFSYDRSRLVMSMLSAFIVAVLFAHRIALASASPTLVTPLDAYWILVLGWYSVVLTWMTAYLLYKWKAGARPERHRFQEGLVGSLFFYHGLPRKARLITYAGSSLLGGIPTYFAVRIASDPAAGVWPASLLIVPVILMTLAGAAYASRWVGTTASGEV